MFGAFQPNAASQRQVFFALLPIGPSLVCVAHKADVSVNPDRPFLNEWAVVLSETKRSSHATPSSSVGQLPSNVGTSRLKRGAGFQDQRAFLNSLQMVSSSMDCIDICFVNGCAGLPCHRAGGGRSGCKSSGITFRLGYSGCPFYDLRRGYRARLALDLASASEGN